MHYNEELEQNMINNVTKNSNQIEIKLVSNNITIKHLLKTNKF